MATVHQMKGWKMAHHPDRRTKDELIRARLERHESEMKAKAKVTELEEERDELLKRIVEIDEQKERLVKVLEKEKFQLMATVLAKDEMIEEKQRQLDEELKARKAAEKELKASLEPERFEMNVDPKDVPDDEELVPAGQVDVGPLMDVTVDIPADLNLSRYRMPGTVSDEQWTQVPDVISVNLVNVLTHDVPISANVPYIYLQAGLLPHFIAAFFMEFQKPRKNTSYETVFGRAMHLMEEYREWLYHQTGAFDSDVTAIGAPIPTQEEPSEEEPTPGPSKSPDPASASDDRQTPENQDDVPKPLPPKKRKNYSDWKESEQCNQQ